MHRLLKLVQHLHLLIPALRSSSIRPEEEALRAALEEIDEEIRKPGGMGRMRGKLNELWALVGAVRAARERNRMGGADSNIEWAVVDEDGLARIAQVWLLRLLFLRADQDTPERLERSRCYIRDGRPGGLRLYDDLIAALPFALFRVRLNVCESGRICMRVQSCSGIFDDMKPVNIVV